MAKTVSPVALLASGSSAAGSTRAAPGRTSSAYDNRSAYGGDLTYKINNTTSAPSAPLVVEFQSSHDGVNWYTYYTVAGDTVASSEYSNTIKLDQDIAYLRVITYGNNTNGVTVEVYLQATTGR